MTMPFKHPQPKAGLEAIAGCWRDFRTAAAFLTRLPVGASPIPGDAAAPGYLSRSMGMFPLVGAGIGLAAALALLGAHGLGLHPLASALIGIAVSVALTGALHEDGLADLCDGLGGGRTREDKLRIMRDSRIGTFGALAIVFSVGLRATILAGMPTPGTAAAALIAAGALSRAALPVIVHWLPPARGGGMAAEAGRPDLARVVAASIIALIVGLLILDDRAVAAALLAAGGAATGVALLARSSLGGHTGDVLGASQQAAEIAALVAVAVIA
jgi:adenosylcobinamide-GDP ribazoletransferase